MRIHLHHKLFEKLPTRDKPPSIICSVCLRTYWKVKWLCEYSVISHWKFLTDGPNTQLWSFSAACLLTHFSVCSSTLNLLQGQICCYGQHSQQWHILPCSWPQTAPGNCQLFRYDWQEQKAKFVGKNMKSGPSSHSLCKDDLMVSEHCVVNLTWSWDREGLPGENRFFWQKCGPG